MTNRLTVAEMRDLEKQVFTEQISYSRMVEIINEKFRHQLSDEHIKTFSIEANGCAFPADSKTQTDGGLTKREYLIAKAVQGLSSIDEITVPAIAKYAVQIADAVISAASTPTTPKE